MKLLNSPILTFLMLALFFYLAWYSQHLPESKESTFINTKLAEYDSGHAFTPKQRQLADVWNLTEADAAKPVNLWGEK